MLYQTKNPHGGDIYGAPVVLDFSANTNPFGTPRPVLDAVQESLLTLHRYPDPYCRKLVAAIARFEAVDPSFVLCGNGAAELIYACCEAVRPRKAAELAPTFSEYSLGLERLGCRMARYHLREDLDFVPDEGLLDFLKAEEPDMVFLCNPNNPTGRTADPMLMKQVLDFCRQHDAVLFVDECFLDLTDGGRSMKEYLREYPQLFILKAFTKSYGMAGLRLGYGLSSNGVLLHQMSETVQPWNVSTPAQAAGTAALDCGEFLDRTRALIRTERVWLKNQLEAMGFRVCPSQTNFLLFAGPEDLARQLQGRGIAIRSCDNYTGLGAGWFRIAVRLHEENEQLMAAIAGIMERK